MKGLTPILVSACLLGQKVRYNGADSASSHSVLAAWCAEGRVVPFCPEVAGGLGVPRPAAEIRGDGGAAVLAGAGRVVTAAGADVTAAFLRGAQLALETALARGARLAILKDGSPSCGSGYIYDGTFARRRVAGQGVTAALLEQHGIRVFSEQELDAAAALLGSLEASHPRPAEEPA
jgi:uncharacterized protein YbbK (DUF523 family)